MAEKPAEPAVPFEAKIEYPPFDSVVPVYANNLVVQRTAEEFIISFYWVGPPIALEASEAGKYSSVPATCVARLIVSPQRMPGFVDVLGAHMKRALGAKDGE